MVRILSFYGQKKQKRWRWKSYINKQKTFDKLCNRITGGNPRTVVAFGDGRFSSTSRGHAPGPVNELYTQLRRRRCRVRKVDEFRTSIVCSLCDSRLYGLKVCKDICLTLWNRDVNAGRNIRECFLYMNENEGRRPEALRRL